MSSIGISVREADMLERLNEIRKRLAHVYPWYFTHNMDVRSKVLSEIQELELELVELISDPDEKEVA